MTTAIMGVGTIGTIVATSMSSAACPFLAVHTNR
jgi:Trk K+ transport system NAD-binding subunit